MESSNRLFLLLTWVNFCVREIFGFVVCFLIGNWEVMLAATVIGIKAVIILFFVLEL
jgi:hypothetical protein